MFGLFYLCLNVCVLCVAYLAGILCLYYCDFILLISSPLAYWFTLDTLYTTNLTNDNARGGITVTLSAVPRYCSLRKCHSYMTLDFIMTGWIGSGRTPESGKEVPNGQQRKSVQCKC